MPIHLRDASSRRLQKVDTEILRCGTVWRSSIGERQHILLGRLHSISVELKDARYLKYVLERDHPILRKICLGLRQRNPRYIAYSFLKHYREDELLRLKEKISLLTNEQKKILREVREIRAPMKLTQLKTSSKEH